MDFKTAKKILNSRLRHGLIDAKFTADELYNCGWYLSASAGKEEATLDGQFSADELEAIAAWMRNPQACVDA